MMDRIQIRSNGNIDDNIQGGSGKTGQIKKGSFCGRNIKVICDNKSGEQIKNLNRNSLIDFLNAQPGTEKLNKGFLGFIGRSNDKKIIDTFNAVINNAKDAPLTVTTKLSQEIQQEAMDMLRQKLKELKLENGESEIKNIDEMDAMTLIKSYTTNIPATWKNGSQFTLGIGFGREIPDEMKTPIAVLLAWEALQNKEGENTKEEIKTWINGQLFNPKYTIAANPINFPLVFTDDLAAIQREALAMIDLALKK